MNSCQRLCVLLALLVSGCASWHKPSLVYRGRNTESRSEPTETFEEQPGVAVVFVSNEEEDEASFRGESEAITPPIEGKAHRTRYRPIRTRAEEEAEQQAREAAPFNPPPEHGYLELAPPRSDDDEGPVRLGRRGR